MPSYLRNLLLAAPVVMQAYALPQSMSKTGHPEGGWVNVTADPGPVVFPHFPGSAYVFNACPFPVESNIVHAPRPGAKGSPEEYPSILQPGQNKTHPFLHDPGMGISWKLVRNGSGPVQFEWTWAPEQHKTYWDLSMIDAATFARLDLVEKRTYGEHGEEAAYNEEAEGQEEIEEAETYEAPVDTWRIRHGFADYGISVKVMVGGRNATKAEGGDTCIPIACPKGSPVCVQAYNAPEDWSRQHACAEHVDLKLTLCG